MSTAATNPPISPGVGARRKGGPKAIPRLPLSAFSPPNSGTGERFPLPPSPATVHPDTVIDAAVTPSALTTWEASLGPNLDKRISGVVLTLDTADTVPIVPLPVIGVSLPLPSDPSTPPLTSVPFSYRVIWTGLRDHPVTESLKKLYSSGSTSTLEVDIQATQLDEADWEALEAFLSDTLDLVPGEGPKPNIILSNILPAPRSLEIETVKLLTDPVYLSYQRHTAALSLMTSVYIKYAPPAWGRVPSTNGDDASEHTEWRRRIKMYLGPIVEAFGTDRILYASSGVANPGDWYELARESVAELGVEQDAVDAIFSGNVNRIFGQGA